MSKLRFWIFLMIVLSSTSEVLSQEAEEVTTSKVNSFIDSLKSKGISKIGYKKNYCIGGVPFTTINKIDGHRTYPCSYYFTLYLFWQDRDGGFIRKYDACGESKEVLIDLKEVFEYLDKYSDTLKREKVKMFSKWDKRGNDSTLVYSIIDHSCYCDLLFLDKGDSIFKNLDFYDLHETNYEGERNLSYSANKKLKIVQWEEQLGSIVAKLEKEEKLKTRN